jgi:GNAT superfamily N-acetyltransferase
MYGELAGMWARSGFFEHQVHIFAGDPAFQEAWVALGFGRTMTAAMRPVADPVALRPVEHHADVRRASDEDLDVVMELGDTLFRFHSLSPIFWPFLNEPRAASREYQQAMLHGDENGYFVAYEGGRPVAMQTYLRDGFLPRITPQERNTYLFEGVVEPDVRGGGLGSQLLAHGLAWAKEQGDEYCTLHFASANPSGAPFWLGHGFVPVEYAMNRHVDERVAWANGWAS